MNYGADNLVVDRRTHTHTQTDTQIQAATIPEGKKLALSKSNFNTDYL